MDIDLQKNTEKQFFFYLKGKPIDFFAAKNERLIAIARFFRNVLFITSHLKKASDTQWQRCTPLQNTHILPHMLRFFIVVRLALGRDLHF